MIFRPEPIKQRLIGVLLCLATLALLTGHFARHIPLSSPVGTLARIFDGLAPHILICAFVLALVAAVAGARLVGGLICVLALLAGGWLGMGHYRRSLPLVPDAPPELSVLFFNVQTENLGDAPPRPGEAERARRILAAVQGENPDVLVFTEAGMLDDVMPELRQTWPHQLTCEAVCEVTILSRWPLERTAIRSMGRLWQNRYTQAAVQLPDGREVTVVAAHLSKPWFSGTIENEAEDMIRWLRRIQGPLVLVGDFNAPPWTYFSRGIMVETGIMAPRVPVPTWPTSAGNLGVPIDNIFVRGGARLISFGPFGDRLGSNHRGLKAQIALE